MSGPEDKAHVEVVRHGWAQEDDERSYYVFWRTENACGSRGVNLTRDHAEHVARSIRSYGPNAPISDYKPWVVLTSPSSRSQR